MSTPRRPYARLLQGCIDDALKAGASKPSALLLALLLTHRAKRSIPGLLNFGPSGLAESLSGHTATEVKRGLAELERYRLILTDADTRPPLVYVIGAVKADPPTTENATRGMAIQLREMPDSHVRGHVHAEITEALQGSAWLAKWREWSGPEATLDSRPDRHPESGTESGPLRDPRSANREPDPDTAAATARSSSEVERFLKAFSERRLQVRGSLYSRQPRDPNDVASLLAEHGFDKLLLMADAMFRVKADVDGWLAASDCSVAVLKHRAGWLADRIDSAGHRPPSTWNRVLQALDDGGLIPKYQRTEWLASCRELRREGDSLVVSTSGPEHLAFIEKHYRPALDAAARSVDQGLEVRFEAAGRNGVPDATETRARQHFYDEPREPPSRSERPGAPVTLPEERGNRPQDSCSAPLRLRANG